MTLIKQAHFFFSFFFFQIRLDYFIKVNFIFFPSHLLSKLVVNLDKVLKKYDFFFFFGFLLMKFDNYGSYKYFFLFEI